MNKISGWILMGFILFSLIRLILIFQGKTEHVYLDFIAIIFLSLIILYIEKPFVKRQIKRNGEQMRESTKLKLASIFLLILAILVFYVNIPKELSLLVLLTNTLATGFTFISGGLFFISYYALDEKSEAQP